MKLLLIGILLGIFVGVATGAPMKVFYVTTPVKIESWEAIKVSGQNRTDALINALQPTVWSEDEWKKCDVCAKVNIISGISK